MYNSKHFHSCLLTLSFYINSSIYPNVIPRSTYPFFPLFLDPLSCSQSTILPTTHPFFPHTSSHLFSTHPTPSPFTPFFLLSFLLMYPFLLFYRSSVIILYSHVIERYQIIVNNSILITNNNS